MKIQEAKTKNRTGKANILVYSIIILGAVFIFTAPFWHVDLPMERKEISLLKEKLESKETLLVNELLDLRNAYDNGNISAEDYIVLSDSKQNELTDLKLSNSTIILETIDEQRILSWKSPRAFILGLGVRLPYVLFSLVISLLILERKNDSKHLRNAFKFLQIACWSISAYLMIWVFWDFQDYSLKTYRYGFIVASILMGTTCAYFISNLETTVSKLKFKIRYVMNLMVKQAVDNGHIKDEERYDDEIVYPALRKLDE